MRISTFVGALCFVASVSLAHGEPPSEAFPRVVLTRVFTHGGSESLTLRCVKVPPGGPQVFSCDVIRFRNNIDVGRVKLTEKLTRAILASFFQLFPSDQLTPRPRELKVIEAESRTVDPSYIWDISFEKKTAQGFVRRSNRGDRNVSVMRAVLSLEGALESQFYGR